MEHQMPVEVKVTANFAKLIGGVRSARAEGSTIGEVLDDLDQRHPGFKQNVVAEGRIHRFVNVYLNDEDVRFLQQLEARPWARSLTSAWATSSGCGRRTLAAASSGKWCGWARTSG